MSNKNKLHFENINRQSFSFSPPVNLSLKHPENELQTQLTGFHLEGLKGFSVCEGVIEGEFMGDRVGDLGVSHHCVECLEG